jgi:hypothetical protein
MPQVDVQTLRAAKKFARQEYDKQVMQEAGTARADYGDAGPPNWNRQAWEAFKAQYGKYPYSAEERPPDLDTAPPWVKQLCGIHLTPAER